jgi:hypothetical protein
MGLLSLECPNECEHPQPFELADGKYLCGQCWVQRRIISECSLVDISIKIESEQLKTEI